MSSSFFSSTIDFGSFRLVVSDVFVVMMALDVGTFKWDEVRIGTTTLVLVFLQQEALQRTKFQNDGLLRPLLRYWKSRLVLGRGGRDDQLFYFLPLDIILL